MLISAALNPTGTPGRLVAEWRAGAFEVVVSPELLAELEDAFEKPKIRKRISEAASALVIDSVREGARLVDDPIAPERVVRNDPDDDYLVALARTAGTDVIVSGDRHLLDQKGLTPPAVTPAHFLALLRALP